jgi:hypothetical protein
MRYESNTRVHDKYFKNLKTLEYALKYDFVELSGSFGRKFTGYVIIIEILSI